jgi:hypothetical protein
MAYIAPGLKLIATLSTMALLANAQAGCYGGDSLGQGYTDKAYYHIEHACKIDSNGGFKGWFGPNDSKGFCAGQCLKRSYCYFSVLQHYSS